jgi:hypothetical protein
MMLPPALSPRGYLTIFALALALSFAAVWAYVALLPIAFLDDEYPRWAAKHDMLDVCDLGDVLVAGDSRAAVDLAPTALPLPTTNLALAGTSSIETFFSLQRALACPHLPKLVIISISPSHFADPDTIWSKSTRYQYLNLTDLLDIYRTSAELNDWSTYRDAASDGLPPLARTYLHAAEFPPLYFASLANGGVFARLWRNMRIQDTVRRARGQYFFIENESGTNDLAPEALLHRFQVSRVIDRYFDRTLALLATSHLHAVFLGMPLNDASAAAAGDGLREGLAAYLRLYAGRYPDFGVPADPLPHWPSRYIGDRLSHMNSAGVWRYGTALTRCLPALMQRGSAENEGCRLIGWTR